MERRALHDGAAQQSFPFTNTNAAKRIVQYMYDDIQATSILLRTERGLETFKKESADRHRSEIGNEKAISFRSRLYVARAEVYGI